MCLMLWGILLFLPDLPSPPFVPRDSQRHDVELLQAASPIKQLPCQFTGLELGAGTSQGLPLCLRARPRPWSLGEGFLAAPCR